MLQINPHAKTMKSLVPAALVLTLIFTAGCNLFRHHHKNRAPELPPATAVEAEFRDRWMQKRVPELLNSGDARTEAEARTMAAAEFARRFPFIGSATSGARR
jgi:hypothetical protein